jgi:hypothetical protein
LGRVADQGSEAVLGGGAAGGEVAGERAADQADAGRVDLGTFDEPVDDLAQDVFVVGPEVQTLDVEGLPLTRSFEGEDVVTASQGVGNLDPSGGGGGVVAGGEQQCGSGVLDVRATGAEEVALDGGVVVGDADRFGGVLDQREGRLEGVDVRGKGVLQAWVVEVGADEVERLPVVLARAQERRARADRVTRGEGRLGVDAGPVGGARSYQLA